MNRRKAWITLILTVAIAWGSLATMLAIGWAVMMPLLMRLGERLDGVSPGSPQGDVIGQRVS